jgi:hypothetical protein
MLKRILLSGLLLIVFGTTQIKAQFAGGSGTEEDPYQISTVEELQAIRDYPDKHFIQINDIDASETVAWNDSTGFEPIGNMNSRFTGSLHGNGHIIFDLMINRINENYAGLFGVMQNARLQNIHMIDVDISAKHWIGGLAGSMNGGSIEQSSVAGFINGEEFVGGLTGRLNQGTIRTSYSDASINGKIYVGGITGYIEFAEIAHSYSLSDITGVEEIGGLAGTAINIFASEDTEMMGVISESFATGLVVGKKSAGGLIGSVSWIVLTKTDKNHPYPRLSNIKPKDTKSLAANYWDSVATGQPYSIGYFPTQRELRIDTAGLSTKKMTGQNAYIHMLDFDFYDTWQLTTGYPVLSWEGADDTVEIPVVPRIITEGGAIEFGTSGIGIQKTIDFTLENTGIADLSVNVSVAGPDESLFTIDPSNQSLTISPNTTISIPVHFTPESGDSVQANLQIEHTAQNEVTPIVVSLSGEGIAVDFAGGSGTADDPWQIETLDHLDDIRLLLQDHYIQMNDLDASATSQWNNGEGFHPIGDSDTGFSGSFNGNDYEIHGLFINRPDTIGVGLFGFMDQGTIEGITLKEVQITGGRYTGSLVGFKRRGTIMHSHTEGTVQGTEAYTGGIIGFQRRGEVRNISSSVNVEGLDKAGGLIGFNGAIVTDSWASGTVNGQSEVGGLTGRNGYAPPLEGYISRSYATGNVAGQEQVGGLSGSHLNGEIENVFSTGDVSGESTIGGLIGDAFEDISYAYAIGTIEGDSQAGGVAGLTGTFSPFRFTYWNVDVAGVSEASGSGSSDGMTGVNTSEMQLQSTYKDWDFDEIWMITEGETYPYLQNLGLPVSNEDEAKRAEVPRKVELHQNYPNPFNPSTVIGYQLPVSSYVSLEVFDLLGRQVAILVNGKQSAGQYTVTFDASNLSSGFYIYRIQAGEFVSTKKLMLIK